MTIRKHVGLHDYCFANYAFDRESAAINLWRDPLYDYATSSIGQPQYVFHSYEPFTPTGTEYPLHTDLSLMQSSMRKASFLANFATKIDTKNRIATDCILLQNCEENGRTSPRSSVPKGGDLALRDSRKTQQACMTQVLRRGRKHTPCE